MGGRKNFDPQAKPTKITSNFGQVKVMIPLEGPLEVTPWLRLLLFQDHKRAEPCLIFQIKIHVI